MTDVPKLLSADLALELLENTSGLSSLEICQQVLAIRSLSPGMAERLSAALLFGDPRFSRLPDGNWVQAGAAAESVPLEEAVFVVVDVETTGFRPPADRVIEVAAVRVAGGAAVEEFSTLVNPGRPIPGPITGLTGITWDMVARAPEFSQVAEDFLDFLGDSVFVAHNAPFDWRFIQSEVSLAAGRRLLNRRLCTRHMAARLCPELSRRSLDDLARFFNLDFGQRRHRALGDARVAAEALLLLVARAKELGIENLATLFECLEPRKTRKK
ncbi:MAG: 3'-5' exonuclease [Candidatus Glassbacteria bacterium]|nr:3'-5' exonuclease [Candidatus Glassbacteria bacterium]